MTKVQRPSNMKQYKRIEEAFKAWVVSLGCEIEAGKNQFEVLRFKSQAGTLFILYKNKFSKLTWTEDMQKLWHEYATGSTTSTIQKKKRSPNKQRLQWVVSRDGDRCFYCQKIVPEEERTLEHLLSVSHGGSNHNSNLAMACVRCNKQAANLPIIEKIKLRESEKQ